MPLPKPAKGEKERDYISRCISFVKHEDPKTPTDQAVAMCYTTWRKAKGIKRREGMEEEKKEEIKDWQKLTYNVPIKESLNIGGDFLIKGIAINETTTRNGIKYIAEELLNAAPTLRNRPILKDHNNFIDSIVGRTTENVYFNSINKNIEFEGKIVDKKIQEMINDKLIQSVSVGAIVHDLEEDEENEITIAKGIEFVELSLVAVPADPNAGFAKAIYENFELKKKCEGAECELEELKENLPNLPKVEIITEGEIENQESQSCSFNQTEDTQGENLIIKSSLEKMEQEKESKLSEKELELKETEIKALKEELAKYKSKEAKIAREAEIKEMITEEIKKLKESLSVKEEVEPEESKEEPIEEPKEEVVDEPKEEPTEEPKEEVEEPKDETKGEISTEEEKVEIAGDYVIERANRGFALYRKSYDGSNFKRLTR